MIPEISKNRCSLRLQRAGQNAERPALRALYERPDALLARHASECRRRRKARSSEQSPERRHRRGFRSSKTIHKTFKMGIDFGQPRFYTSDIKNLRKVFINPEQDLVVQGGMRRADNSFRLSCL